MKTGLAVTLILPIFVVSYSYGINHHVRCMAWVLGGLLRTTHTGGETCSWLLSSSNWSGSWSRTTL